MAVQGALRPLLIIALLCGVASAETHPRFDRCKGKWPPDPPGLGKAVALTFDDGPSVALTPRVLAVLRKHKAPATFFFVGERIRGKQARALVAEIAGDPLFDIGNHTQTHPTMSKLAADAAAVEIDRAGAIIEQAAGRAPRWFRFPYSLSTCATAELVRKRGYRIAGWHVDSADWCFASGGGRCSKELWADLPDELRGDMIQLVRARLRDSDGGILLLHDIHKRTVDRLDELLTRLSRDGYHFVRLDDAGVFPLLNRP
jgi:peptidoglycan/xylan/chitin deacetylase (PgdA/CDA1 family)